MENNIEVGDYLKAKSTIRLTDETNEAVFTAGKHYRVERIVYRPNNNYLLEVIDDTISYHNMETKYVQEHFKWVTLHDFNSGFMQGEILHSAG